ncbi:CopG family transcriptional regulator [Pseudonocardia acaciae]|uniref:ribbon-helix-helix domain-containing protein n=1 Tax=Pseudonocardia acaciae TaxID=551276 RepID=UPI00048B17C5|nr:CopG family transcriptional regulator [Pseudonocardia acaciae]
MRTTLTLDDDVAAMLHRVAKERGISFKEAVNTALRAGLTAGVPQPRRFRMQTSNMGVVPGVNLDKALQLAAELEDEEIIRKLELGK